MRCRDDYKRKINNKLLRYSYILELPVTLSVMPNSLDIEVTNKCMLNCIKCPRNIMDRAVGQMSLELFKSIIDQSYPYIYFSWLHLFGDPILNPKLPDMIRYASEKGIKCGISTNGIALNEKVAKEISLAGTDTIIISIDALSEKTYSKIRKGGNFKKVIENTEKFLILPERRLIKNTIIQMIDMEVNHEEVDKFIDRWQGPDRIVNIKTEDSWAGCYKINKKTPNVKRFPCKKLWERLTIDWEGNISICCRDYKMKMNLGNVKEDSLKKIWNGNKMRKYRRSMVMNNFEDISLCRNCDEWIYSDDKYKNYVSY